MPADSVSGEEQLPGSSSSLCVLMGQGYSGTSLISTCMRTEPHLLRPSHVSTWILWRHKHPFSPWHAMRLRSGLAIVVEGQSFHLPLYAALVRQGYAVLQKHTTLWLSLCSPFLSHAKSGARTSVLERQISFKWCHGHPDDFHSVTLGLL